VEGELINTMGQNERHAYAIQLLTAILVDHFKRQVRIQLPIDVSPQDNPTSEPQPDAVVTTPAAALTSKQPGPGDIVWLVEVSDSTLRFDLTVKARLYARAGIPEYWVVDLIHRNLIVHREPSGDQYLSVNAYGADEPVVVPQSVATLLRFADLIGADD
jgi:Uma2 family endonuclease